MFDFGMFTNVFMIHAWISGSVIAILSSCIGFFIIMRSSTFIAHALPEAGFAGGASSIFFAVNPILGLLVFTVGGALLMGRLEKKEHEDVATALVLVTSLGLGALFLGLTNQYAEGAYSLLFGQIVGVSDDQVIQTFLLAFICLVLLALIYRPLLLSSLSKDIAKSRGIPVRLIESIFLLVIAISVSVIIPIVGTLLCFSLLITPSAASIYLTSHPAKALVFAIIISLLDIWFSISLAYLTTWPIGFFVSTIGLIFYMVARLIHYLKDSKLIEVE
ncbi:MAG TPA: metal ABC transporter permease [Lactovum miscens]|uniref:metal ABC transporter permease n=1 Tax=Lactovum miscens TaxID=190387 RepID=UPI002ED98219